MTNKSQTTGTDPVMAALGATTEETTESIQYVLIRGLSAMGYAQPSQEAYALMQAALAASGAQQATAFDDGMTLGRRSAIAALIKNLEAELDKPEGADTHG